MGNFEKFLFPHYNLENVPIFMQLTPYEREKIIYASLDLDFFIKALNFFQSYFKSQV